MCLDRMTAPGNDSGITTKCPFCGRLYKVYPDYTGDQPACPSCVAEAERNMQEIIPKSPDWR